MKVVFLTMVPIDDINQRGIYTDLMRYFVFKGHQICIISPYERRLGKTTGIHNKDGVLFLGVRTFNLQKTSILEKSIGQLFVETQYKRAIKKYLSNERFDYILYSTPPITLIGAIKCLRIINPDARTYLLLKDIFPQNAVDLGLLANTGLKGLAYYYFRRKERTLYSLSDNIGCMSPANVDYILKHNPEISKNRIEIAPNSIELKKEVIDVGESLELRRKNEKYYIRVKYNLPTDRPIFVYGGNLGKPQGISFLIKCLEANNQRLDCHFVIVGSGTERQRLEKWISSHKPKSVSLLNRLPKDDYDVLVGSCDVGLIFLDYRFTIPNYPSRLLPYLENKMPIIAATDPNCDLGRIAENNGFGYWCESNSVEDFTAIINKMIHSDRKVMGEKGYEFLKKNYLVENTYNAIMSHV